MIYLIYTDDSNRTGKHVTKVLQLATNSGLANADAPTHCFTAQRLATSTDCRWHRTHWPEEEAGLLNFFVTFASAVIYTQDTICWHRGTHKPSTTKPTSDKTPCDKTIIFINTHQSKHSTQSYIMLCV